MNTYDLVVVGSGAAGLTAALHSFPLKTLVLTKTSSLNSGSTPWAQGGISFPVDPQDVPYHQEDTLKSGAGLCRPEAVEVLVREALQAQGWLEALGYPFDRVPGAGPGSGGSTLLRGREGGHGVPRILHAGGDASGRFLSEVLVQKARQVSHLTLHTDTTVLSLEKGDQGITGLTIWSPESGFQTIRTRRVILAGGGLGQLFGQTTNPPEATGDALALGLEIGAEGELMEMVQFHPTGLEVSGRGSQPLLTEALRGAGARLVLDDGSELQVDHPLGILGTRDAVARAVFREKARGRKVYMDVREKPGSELRTKFPSVFSLCLKAGFDPLHELLPIIPVVHYHMGGLKTDLNGRTSVPGLWAVGECASVGIHGANRLASNSLLECLVFGRRAGLDAADTAFSASSTLEARVDSFSHEDRNSGTKADWERIKTQVQKVVFMGAGPVRNAQILQESLDRLVPLVKEARQCFPNLEDPSESQGPNPRELRELKSFLTLAPRLLHAALERRESTGAHFRTDSPRKS